MLHPFGRRHRGVEGDGGDPARRGAEAPTAEGEAITVAGHDNGIGMARRQLGGGGDVVDANCRGEQTVDERADRDATRRDVRPDRIAAIRRDVEGGAQPE